MKDKPASEDYSDQFKNEDTSIIPEKPLDNTREILSPEKYYIPERENKTWCSFMERGFRASRNITDKQSGTKTETHADIIEVETQMKILQPEELKK